MESVFLAAFLFFIIATLYSSVGHAGASGYLAVMALLSFAPETIKPISLTLNILVATIASFQFIKKGFFDRRIFFIVITASIPTSFLGGYISLDPKFFKLIAGVFLLASAAMLIIKAYIKPKEEDSIRQMTLWMGLVTGGLIGLFSGLIGVGGGIFLSPIMILASWTNVKNASGVAALFILINSISALAGHITAYQYIDGNITYWVVAVVFGGIIGSRIGTSAVRNKVVIALLFIVLMTAGIKFVFVDYFLAR